MGSEGCIRILELLPGEGGCPIECTTRIIHLGDTETYEAVSYVWGNGPQSQNIQVSGKVENVTKSLHAALEQFRHPTNSRSIWIDQLCINQSDTKEKTQQVNLMGQIYKQCTQSLIWLGVIPEVSARITIKDAQAAFDFISAVAGEMAGGEQGPIIPSSLATPEQVDGARRAFKALIFQGNPWWSRIWTVQEAVLPSKGLLQWGPLSLPWDTLFKAANNICLNHHTLYKIYSLYNKFADLIDNFTGPIRGLQIAQQTERPLNLLHRWRHRKASNLRDKVYALMGLYPSMPFSRVRSCDYELDTASLYKHVTIDLIKIENSLKPLVGLLNHSDLNLPTWAIDLSWCPNMDVTDFWWRHSQRYDWLDACSDWALNMEVLDGDSVLSLHGCHVDKVEEVSSIIFDEYGVEIGTKELITAIDSWWEAVRRHISNRLYKEKYPNGSSWFEAFWRTLIGDMVTAEFPKRRANDSDGELFKKFILAGNTKGQLWTESKNAVCRSLWTMAKNQRFYISVNGYFGLGPPNTVRGDEVWVLSGSKVPFILRSREQAQKGLGSDMVVPEFTLVGNTFVHGIMDGEALRGCESLQNIYIY